MIIQTVYDDFVHSILANPITKLPANINEFNVINGIIDARVYLKNTHGFADWKSGQEEFENWDSNELGYRDLDEYKLEISRDAEVYKVFKMSGVIADVGGGPGIVREFLQDDCKYISIDPHIDVVKNIPSNKHIAYQCLSKPLNFIAGTAEFLPVKSNSVDWVHMRSMLDHVQVPDLALIEARRVLVEGGNLLVGLLLESGPDEKYTPKEILKLSIKSVLGVLGIEKYRDHHVWHPTFSKLKKIINDNGFQIEKIYWQPGWNEKVCYIHGVRK